MPELLAAIRPDDQSFALLLHLVGATVVFGALLASATSLAAGARRDPAASARLLLAPARRPPRPDPAPARRRMALPAPELGRASRPDRSSPPGSAIGFIVADWGGLLLLLALALGGVGIHRLGNGKGGTVLLKATMVISLILILAYVVAVWAMTGKPN